MRDGCAISAYGAVTCTMNSLDLAPMRRPGSIWASHYLRLIGQSTSREESVDVPTSSARLSL